MTRQVLHMLREQVENTLETITELMEDADSEEGRQRIHELPLGVYITEGWHAPGTEAEPSEYKILLGTGGPHIEIGGELNCYGEPGSAALVGYWSGETWSTIDTKVLEFARSFYFGE